MSSKRQAVSTQKALPHAAALRKAPVNKENESPLVQKSMRDRRVSAKVAEQQREKEEAAARKEEAVARRAARARKLNIKQAKASGITQDSDASDLEERQDTVFTAHMVVTKPAQHALSAAHAVAKARPAVSPTPAPLRRRSKVPSAPSQHITEDTLDVDMFDNLPDSNVVDDLNNDDRDSDSDVDGHDDDHGDVDEHDDIDELEYTDEYDPAPPDSQLCPLPGKPLPPRMVLDLHTSSSQPSKRPRSDSLDNAAVAPTRIKATKITNKQSSSDSLNTVAAVPTKIKATKINDNTGRPKASDYDD
ncbi:hypothetical protein H0H92_004411, partial [Tricholoma furcatifolium]